jgi:hypothetical protein
MKVYGLIYQSNECKVFQEKIYKNPIDAINDLKAELSIENSSFLENWVIVNYLNEGRKYFKIADDMHPDGTITVEYFLFEIEVNP